MDSLRFPAATILLTFFVCWCYAKSVAVVAPDDMDKFRAENRIVLNDELSDLNATTVEVIALQQRIKAIEKKGDELLATIPDNGVICATQVRYRIGILILERMSELVDNCVSIHLDADNSPNLNANQIGCINETLISADRDVDAMKVNVEECKLFI